MCAIIEVKADQFLRTQHLIQMAQTTLNGLIHDKHLISVRHQTLIAQALNDMIDANEALKRSLVVTAHTGEL